MTRLICAMAVAFTSIALTSAAEDEKPIKADVSIDAKVMLRPYGEGKAKAGQMVEVRIPVPPIPLFAADFNVTVDGKQVEFDVRPKSVERASFPATGVPSFGLMKSIYIKAAGKGKQKVVITHQGGRKHMFEIELEVTE